MLTMEKEEKDILLKIRSSRACIRDGYRLYTANFRRIFKNTWPLALGFAILSTAASALPSLMAPTYLLPGILLEVAAVILLLVAASRVLHKKGLLQHSGKPPVKSWMRHLGLVFVVVIVCLFIVSVLTLLTSLPATIMITANWQSQMGVMYGDPSGMPGYVRWLSIGAFLIAGFLKAYVWLTTICPLYLTSTSIALQEKERKEYNTKKHEKSIVYRP